MSAESPRHDGAPDGSAPAEPGESGASYVDSERRRTMHDHGSRLVTDVDSDAGTLDEVVYQQRVYPFVDDETFRLGRSNWPGKGEDRISVAVLDADGNPRGRTAIFKSPSGEIDLEVNGLSESDLISLEGLLQTLTPRDAVDDPAESPAVD